MQITVTYQPQANELAKASSLFVEKKPFLLFSVGFINVVTAFFLGIFFLKLILSGLTIQEWTASLGCALWLFGRRPLNEWILYQRMKHSSILEKPIRIQISLNGLIWSGKGLRSGNMSWDQIKYVQEAQNGFIIPNAMTKFLWLPFRGFDSDENIQALRQIIKEKKIRHQVYAKWKC